MHTFELRREQWIPGPRDAVFAFFAAAANLEAITPPWLRFRILSPGPHPPRAGTEIVYRLRWRWLPLRWVTEIAVWEPPVRFVDVQRHGPYTCWHHTHEFESRNGGTLMHDLVRYALPLGLLGAAAYHLIVRRDLDAIFDYRAREITKYFRGRR